MNKIKKILQNKFINNVSWIFIGSVFHAVLQFLLNIYIARVFTTDNFGLINYASAWIAFFTSLGTLGFYSTITKNFAEDEENAGTYLGTAIKSRLIYSVLAIVLLQLIMKIISPGERMLSVIVFFQSLSILFYSFDSLIYWFRYKGAAKKVEISRLVAFFISAAWRLLVVAVFKSVLGYVIGVTAENIIFMLLLYTGFKKHYPTLKLKFSWDKFKSMMAISYPFIFSVVLMSIYGQTDRIMLKSMLDNTAVAMYSTALTLAGAISIIPTALIEGFRPEIMNYKTSDENMYRHRLMQLYALVFWISIAYCVFITVFAKWIILLTYGKKYLGSVPVLSLVVWYNSFAFFGSINNLYMVAENKSKWVQLTTLTGALTNVVLNLILIPKYGMQGAAGASLITQIITNFVILYFIPDLREDFFIIIRSIFFFVKKDHKAKT